MKAHDHMRGGWDGPIGEKFKGSLIVLNRGLQVINVPYGPVISDYIQQGHIDPGLGQGVGQGRRNQTRMDQYLQSQFGTDFLNNLNKVQQRDPAFLIRPAADQNSPPPLSAIRLAASFKAHGVSAAVMFCRIRPPQCWQFN